MCARDAAVKRQRIAENAVTPLSRPLAAHSRPFTGWVHLKALAEVAEGECLTATVPSLSAKIYFRISWQFSSGQSEHF